MTVVASNSCSPKLVVCDLDQDLLGDRDAEVELFETWMAWDEESRPLMVFHSQMPLPRLREALPATSLPPANFLIGAAASMLVRFTFWQQISASGLGQSDRWSGMDAERLLTVVATRALSELDHPNVNAAGEFPKVASAVLTTSGLSVVLASSDLGKQHNTSVALSWILKQLALSADEVRTYRPRHQTRPVLGRCQKRA